MNGGPTLKLSETGQWSPNDGYELNSGLLKPQVMEFTTRRLGRGTSFQGRPEVGTQAPSMQRCSQACSGEEVTQRAFKTEIRNLGY